MNASAHSPLLTDDGYRDANPTAASTGLTVITQISATSDTITVNWSEATPVDGSAHFFLLSVA